MTNWQVSDKFKIPGHNWGMTDLKLIHFKFQWFHDHLSFTTKLTKTDPKPFLNVIFHSSKSILHASSSIYIPSSHGRPNTQNKKKKLNQDQSKWTFKTATSNHTLKPWIYASKVKPLHVQDSLRPYVMQHTNGYTITREKKDKQFKCFLISHKLLQSLI